MLMARLSERQERNPGTDMGMTPKLESLWWNVSLL